MCWGRLPLTESPRCSLREKGKGGPPLLDVRSPRERGKNGSESEAQKKKRNPVNELKTRWDPAASRAEETGGAKKTAG